MSLFLNFRERLKVKTQTEKRYTLSDINLRLDKETGKIGMYLIEKLVIKNQSSKAWTIHKYKKREVNIEDSNNIIEYEVTVSPSGLFSETEYKDSKDLERYGIRYSKFNIFTELDGYYDKDKLYTREELLQLIRRINDERKYAKCSKVYKVQYNDDYTGKRLLDGKHIAVESYYEENKLKTNLVCVEDEDVSFEIRENEELSILINREKETVNSEQVQYIMESLPYLSSSHYTCLGGYTLKAIREILKIKEMEKEEIKE